MPETDQTLSLIAAYQHSHDPRVGDRLLISHDRWLHHCARTAVTRYNIAFDDALQAARIGFLAAVERFDPTVGVTLMTYALPGTMRKEFTRASAERNLSPLLPNGLYAEGRLRQMRKAVRMMEAEGTVASDEAIAARLGWGLETLRDLRAAEHCTSLDTPVGEDGEETRLIDLVPGSLKSPHQAAVEKLDGAKVMEAVEWVLDGVGDREADIFRRRFIEGETLEAVGEVYGLTRERIRQLESRVVTLMRESLAGDPRVMGFLV